MLHFPEAQAENDGNSAILTAQQGMQQMLKQALNSNYENDAIVLSKATMIICEDIFNLQGWLPFQWLFFLLDATRVSNNYSQVHCSNAAEWTRLEGLRFNRFTGMPHSSPSCSFQVQKEGKMEYLL